MRRATIVTRRFLSSQDPRGNLISSASPIASYARRYSSPSRLSFSQPFAPSFRYAAPILSRKRPRPISARNEISRVLFARLAAIIRFNSASYRRACAHAHAHARGTPVPRIRDKDGRKDFPSFARQQILEIPFSRRLRYVAMLGIRSLFNPSFPCSRLRAFRMRETAFSSIRSS